MRGLVAGLLAGAACAPPLEEVPRERVVVAEFAPGRLPLPNDLLLDERGHPVLPAPTWAAEAELARYLSTLDGFPPSMAARARFSGPLEPASVTPSSAQRSGAVFVFDLSTMQPLRGDDAPGGSGDYHLELDEDGAVLVVRPHLPEDGLPARRPWRLGHRYAVVIFGGADARGLRGRDDGDDPDGAAATVVPSTMTRAITGTRPLLSPCADGDVDIAGPRCLCVLEPDGRFDRACRAASGLSYAEAEQLERRRRQSRALLATLLPLAGAERRDEDVVALWQFTIAHGPFAVWEPESRLDGRLPLPSELLVDPTAEAAGDPGASALLPPFDARSPRALLGLGAARLDGFSTTAPVRFPVDVAEDVAAVSSDAAPRGLARGTSALLLDLTEPARAPDYQVAAERVGGGRDFDGQVTLTPSAPLREGGERYLAALTTDITDALGRPLQPSPAFALMRSPYPLRGAGGRSLVPALLDDAAAAAVESARSAAAWQELAKVPYALARERVAVLSRFRTQSIARPLAELAALPAARAVPTAVTLLEVRALANDNPLGPDVGRLAWGRLRTRHALGADGTLDPSGGVEVELPFLLVAPRGGQAAGVALVQHGLGGWRGDLRALAQALCAAGWAGIAVDGDLHGARAACRADSDCEAGGRCNGATGQRRCSTRLAVRCTANDECVPGASCSPQGLCVGGGFAPDSRLCMTHDEGGAPVTECRPASSGAGFLDLSRPVQTRDRIRQQSIDLSQLSRVLADAQPGSLSAQLLSPALPGGPLRLDGSRVALVGESVGAVGAALAASVGTAPGPLVLASPGARLVDLLLASPSLSPSLFAAVEALGVPRESAEGRRLLDVMRWILDGADPINVARALTLEPPPGAAPRRVIVQEAGQDVVFPGTFAEALARDLGLPLLAGKPAQTSGSGATVSTYFPSAGHRFLLGAEPSSGFAQAQAAAFVASGGRLLTVPGP